MHKTHRSFFNTFSQFNTESFHIHTPRPATTPQTTRKKSTFTPTK